MSLKSPAVPSRGIIRYYLHIHYFILPQRYISLYYSKISTPSISIVMVKVCGFILFTNSINTFQHLVDLHDKSIIKNKTILNHRWAIICRIVKAAGLIITCAYSINDIINFAFWKLVHWKGISVAGNYELPGECFCAVGENVSWQ